MSGDAEVLLGGVYLSLEQLLVPEGMEGHIPALAVFSLPLLSLAQVFLARHRHTARGSLILPLALLGRMKHRCGSNQIFATREGLHE